MEEQDLKCVYNLVSNIAGGNAWELDAGLRAECEQAINLNKIEFDQLGNMNYDGHFVSTIRNFEDDAMWRNHKVKASSIVTSVVKYYTRLLTTMLQEKLIIIPDKELILMTAIAHLDSPPENPTRLAEAIVVAFKNKDDEELETLPREIRKLLKFYYVPETTRRDAKPKA
jgi:hypothetical protein